jgi:hypothetical protein
MRDENELRRVIERARAEINQGRAPLALRHLGEIRRDVEDSGILSLAAQHQLAFAEALATNCDPAAEDEFQDAVQQVTNLPDRDPLLEMRAHEHYARCLCQKKRRSLALKEYELAKKLAVEFGLPEDRARMQLCLMSIMLEIDEDPRVNDFRNLKKVVKDADFTWQEQLAALMQYLGESEVQEAGLQVARKRGSEEYFQSLLKSLREEQRNEISG